MAERREARARTNVAMALSFALGVGAGVLADRALERLSLFLPHKTPGGVWITPTEGQTFTGPIHLKARAYPTNPNDQPVEKVLFTTSWEGRPGPWIIMCEDDEPEQGTDTYSCDWDPKTSKEPVPDGKLNVSFDVYDTKDNKNLAPNGTRVIIYQSK